MENARLMTRIIVENTREAAIENPELAEDLLTGVINALSEALDQLGQAARELTGREPEMMAAFPHRPSIRRAALRMLAEDALISLERDPQGDEPLPGAECCQQTAPDLDNCIRAAVNRYEKGPATEVAIRFLEQETREMAGTALKNLPQDQARKLRMEVLENLS